MARIRPAVVAALVLALGGRQAGAQVDVAGRWLIETRSTAAPTIVTFVQAGTSITTGWGPGQIAADGTFVIDAGDFGATVSGKVLPGATRLVARAPGPNPQYDVFGTVLRGSRCECFDGNATNGDGCDVRCQVEPCFTCRGTPSVCTPLRDGAACDDRNACTTGETCSAGACGGGTPVAGCIDLTGHWRLVRTVNGDDFPGLVDIVQRGTILSFGETFGVIDPMTGALDAATARTANLCPPVEEVHGTAAPDGRAFTATGEGVLFSAVPHPFCTAVPLVVSGSRCGSGTLDPGEECDDGNQTAGDGCDPSCRVEACYTCSGEPSHCAECGACQQCDASGTCVVAPRPSCARTPTRSQLEIRQRGARSRLFWEWELARGGSTVDFGDPRAHDDYAVCAFGPGGLVFSAAVPAGGTCAGIPCWNAVDAETLRYRDPDRQPDGVGALFLQKTAVGAVRTVAKGRGPLLVGRDAGLPVPPVTLPLTLQLQGRGPQACVEARFDARAVFRNKDGRLHAVQR